MSWYQEKRKKFVMSWVCALLRNSDYSLKITTAKKVKRGVMVMLPDGQILVSVGKYKYVPCGINGVNGNLIVNKFVSSQEERDYYKQEKQMAAPPENTLADAIEDMAKLKQKLNRVKKELKARRIDTGNLEMAILHGTYAVDEIDLQIKTIEIEKVRV